MILEIIISEIENPFFVIFIASGKGKVGKETFLEGILTSIPTLGDKQNAFSVHFEWDSSMGIPGAFYIRNYMQGEFFLVSLSLEDVPNQGTINFACNSWIYNFKNYKTDRIFFANKVRLRINYLARSL
jgi:linoleate 9S-lipoxygenase